MSHTPILPSSVDRAPSRIKALRSWVHPEHPKISTRESWRYDRTSEERNRKPLRFPDALNPIALCVDGMNRGWRSDRIHREWSLRAIGYAAARLSVRGNLCPLCGDEIGEIDTHFTESSHTRFVDILCAHSRSARQTAHRAHQALDEKLRATAIAAMNSLPMIPTIRKALGAKPEIDFARIDVFEPWLMEEVLDTYLTFSERHTQPHPQGETRTKRERSLTDLGFARKENKGVLTFSRIVDGAFVIGNPTHHLSLSFWVCAEADARSSRKPNGASWAFAHNATAKLDAKLRHGVALALHRLTATGSLKKAS